MEGRYLKIRKDMETYCDQHGVIWDVKSNDFLMRLTGKIIFFNKKFMTSFTTTRGDKVFFPDAPWVFESADRWCRIMAHELVHVFDFRREGWWETLKYARPQLLALGSLLAFLTFLVPFHPGFWLCLGFLGCLGFLWPPEKSEKRVWAEMRGYAITMMAYKYIYNLDLIEDRAWVRERFKGIVNNFTGPNYFYMWKDEGAVEEELLMWVKRINDGTIDEYIPVAKDLRHIMEGKGVPENQVKF